MYTYTEYQTETTKRNIQGLEKWNIWLNPHLWRPITAKNVSLRAITHSRLKGRNPTNNFTSVLSPRIKLVAKSQICMHLHISAFIKSLVSLCQSYGGHFISYHDAITSFSKWNVGARDIACGVTQTGRNNSYLSILKQVSQPHDTKIRDRRNVIKY